MPLQRSITKELLIPGIDIVSENKSSTRLTKALPYTGIVFRSQGEEIKATLDNIYVKTFPIRTLILQGSKKRVVMPEHILTDLYAFGVDNVYVEIEKEQTWSSRHFKRFGNARYTQFLPYFQDGVCEALKGNVEELDAPKKIWRLEEAIASEDGKIIMKPNSTGEITIHTHTDYLLPSKEHAIGNAVLTINPESIERVSTSRNWCRTFSWAPKWLTKTVACFFYLSHGFGNGNDPTNMFYHTKKLEQWNKQDLFEGNELACHAAYDRAGELCLALEGQSIKGLEVYCSKAGHKDVIDFLKKYRHMFSEAKD